MSGSHGKNMIMAACAALIVAALMLAPNSSQAQPNTDGWESHWLKAGAADLKAKDFDLARADYEKAAVINPQSAQAYVGLARAHAKLGNKSAAYKNFRTALEIEPDNLAALSEGGLAALALDKKDRAEEFRDRLSGLCGVSCNAYQTLTKAVRNYTPPETPVLADGEGTAETESQSELQSESGDDAPAQPASE